MGRTNIEDVLLARLDRLIQVEDRMAAAQYLGATHAVYDEVESVDNEVPWIRQDQLRKLLTNWLSPPDPSVNYNSASDARHEGTSLWFMASDAFKDWKVSNSLLWIYGKRTFPRPSSSLWLIDLYFHSRFGEKRPQVRYTPKSFGRDC